MREYGQIQTAFWQAPDIKGTEDKPGLSDQAKLLACFLLTGPLTNGVGCFGAGNGSLMDHLGWSAETLSERFAELSGNGFAYRIQGIVFIPNFLRWNKIANWKVATARFLEWEQIPKGTLKAFTARAMLEFSDFWSERHRATLETVSHTVSGTVCDTHFSNTGNRTQPNPTLSNPDPNHISPKSTKAGPKVKPVPERFEEFWAAYPRKVSKADAIRAFAKLSADQVTLALSAVPQHVAHWQAVGTEPQYIPHPASWLNGQKWTDDLTTNHAHRLMTAKPSRQAAIAQALLGDPRYAATAQRQPGLALRDNRSRPVDAHPALAAVPAGTGYDSGDGDGLD